MTPEQRVLRAKIAAHTRWARTTDRAAATLPARQAQLGRWEREADPDGVLPPEERARRAESLQAAHMARMRLARSHKAEMRRAAPARKSA